MTRNGWFVLSLVGITFTVFLGEGSLPAAQPAEKPLSKQRAEQLFFDTIQPLLRKRCLGCHGEGDKLESQLDLRSREVMLKGGENGLVLVLGKPEKSSLYLSVLRTGDLVMPPKERNKLTKTEIESLKQWIFAGAPWPKTKPKPNKTASTDWSTKNGIAVATSGGLSPDWTNRKYKPEDLWAYRPIQRYPVPWKVLDQENKRHAVDAFLQSRLKKKGIESTSPASRLTLLRRATFDLTGLPPTPNEIDAFLNDTTSNAFQKVVNRLLKSKRYGEQQARHWLDVVRYADTAGFSNDYERPNAWRYRDYVIRSFNQDKPYDRFILEQLAGDELNANNPELQIAVGFLRMGPWEHTGMSVAVVTRQLFLDDITHSVGETFLGQGLRCSKCHDHKFDPVPTRDYYRIQACFSPVQFADRKVPYQSWENTSGLEKMKPRTEQQLKEAKVFLASLQKKSRMALNKLLEEYGVKTVNALPKKVRHNKKFIGLTKLEVSLEKITRKRIAYFEREMKRYLPLAFSLYNGPPNNFTSNKSLQYMPAKPMRKGKTQTVSILTGGSLESPFEEVSPGVLSAMSASNDTLAPTAWNTIPNSTHGRRLSLAKWITSPNNTLTARVIVNRIWQQYFGKGLVATPNNFGKMGARPTHPELLDWLATWFIEHDWSIKKTHRLIMTSNAYQQSGEHPEMKTVNQTDPNNDLYSYFPARRLAAEEIRDAMLKITGELNPEMGGIGVFPEINWEVAMMPRHIMGSVAPAYQPSLTPGERNRRTIYAFRIRTLPDPLLEVLNRPNADKSCERRDETTVAPQAFTLFNGQFVHDRALALALRLEKLSTEPAQQIEHAFRLVYGRAVTDQERALCLHHVQGMVEHHRIHQPTRVKVPLKVTRHMVEELTGEPFEWDEELDLMKHYQPDTKPWDVGPETRGLAELCLVLLNSNEFLYVR
jgi:hypothetical protein